MITEFKHKDLPKLTEQVAWFYPISSMVADKLRVVWGVFGYKEMLESFNNADDVVDKLLMECVNTLVKNNSLNEITCQQCGMIVSMWIDSEDFINVEYMFNLG